MSGLLRIGIATGIAALVAGPAVAAPIDPASDTSFWTAILYPTSTPDPSADHGTGDREGDIVGDVTHAALYTAFDDNGTPSKTDGNIAFRARLSGDSNPPGFENFFVVGLDAGEDGLNDIDLYLGVDGQGSGDTIGIYDPGAGANVSPSTTTIANSPSVWWDIPGANYNWSAVTIVNDPSATNTDFGAEGNDYFISFVIPFDVLVTQFANYGIAIDEDTAFRYVMGTGTQPNALNQDVGATTVGWSDATTWDALGAISSPYTATGNPAPVPEPDSLALTLLGFALLAVAARHRQR